MMRDELGILPHVKTWGLIEAAKATNRSWTWASLPHVKTWGLIEAAHEASLATALAVAFPT